MLFLYDSLLAKYDITIHYNQFNNFFGLKSLEKYHDYKRLQIF